jgi:hypothetical protein
VAKPADTAVTVDTITTGTTTRATPPEILASATIDAL